MAVEASVSTSREGAIVHDRARLGETARPDWFDPDGWRARGVVTTPPGGRGSAWRVAADGIDAVLRHYRRGGVVARFNRDRYWFTRAEATRPFREFALLRDALAAGLPVPRPLAARYVRDGRWYRADILVEAIPHATTLAQAIAGPDAATVPWAAIGRAIARFHALGFHHADLNAHNVLLREGGAWLIDFDRGERIAPAATWQRDNLDRLRRSLVKLDAARHVPDFLTHAWTALVAAHARALAEAGAAR